MRSTVRPLRTKNATCEPLTTASLWRSLFAMDLGGFEPPTSSMRTRRAPNCATGPDCWESVAARALAVEVHDAAHAFEDRLLAAARSHALEREHARDGDEESDDREQ